MTGPTGYPGPQGTQGVQGAPGPQGTQGPQGPQGGLSSPTVAGLGMILPITRATPYYYAPATGGTTTAALTVNTLYATPIALPWSIPLPPLAFYSTSTSASQVRLGMYANSDAGPGALLADYGFVSTSNTGQKEAAAPSAISIGPGVVWLAMWTPHLSTSFIASQLGLTLPRRSISSNQWMGVRSTTVAVAGPLPDPFGPVATPVVSEYMPVIALKI